jgi:tRNA threonylcarbamoyl adenosine modification protein (Sua5/YciO/YrdC/YwlC family)
LDDCLLKVDCKVGHDVVHNSLIIQNLDWQANGNVIKRTVVVQSTDMKTCGFDEAADILKAGGVGVIPTDTVYGIVAGAADAAAVVRLYALKRRERKPGTIIAASAEQLIGLGLDEGAIRAAEHLWPNPISLIVAANQRLDYLHQGVGSLAVRIPDDARLRALLERTGPLLTSSANQPGEAVAADMHEAQDYFGDSVDCYVDGGNMTGRAPSTIVRIEGTKVVVLREGAVSVPQGSQN